MRTLLIITAVVVQVAVLAFMAGQREYVVRTGTTVYLRTSPVDPMDPFRGEYVSLNYEISDSMRDSLSQVLDDKKKDDRRDVRVYTVLNVDENQVGNALYITDKRPDGELFIRGRTEPSGWRNPIRYGIEAYFVEQGQGREIEKLRGIGDNIRVPLEMETVIGANGIAVLKGHRFGRLGIGIETQRNVWGVTGAKLKLKNVSDTPLAVVDLPEGGSLSLKSDDWRAGNPMWQWVNEGIIAPKPNNKDVHILQPQQEYELTVDLTDPRWYVTTDKQEPCSIGSLNKDRSWGYSFRLVYKSPSKQQCEHLESADLIWHGQLSSTTFGTAGNRD